MAIIGSVRRQATFVIYKDEPQLPSATRKTSAPLSTTRSGIRAVLASQSEKENLNPLTGRRPTNEENSLKKRKTNVLATKLLTVTGKPLAEQELPKKRKHASPLDGPTVKKDKKEKRAANTRKPRTNRVHKAIDLPRLDEVAEEEGDDVDKGVLAEAIQTAVNARCYELTVLPLADLSKAYEQCSSARLFSEREASPESEFEDPPQVVRRRLPSSDTEPEDASSSPVLPRGAITIFNTPERKRIYSAFTFESPSPASRRFASWKESGAERFGKIDFNPIVHLAL